MMQVQAPLATTALNTAAPDLALPELEQLAATFYGIEGRARALASERDQNCCIQCTDGTQYVLKISNPSEDVVVVNFQIAALDHIAAVAPDLPTPRVVRTLDGRTTVPLRMQGGSICTVRMLTYLDGVQVKGTVHTPGQRIAMGRSLAQLDLALRDFSHPAAHHDLLWNVSTAPAKYQEIVECYNVSGGYDYLLKIIASTVSAFQELMERLLEDEIGIEKFASRIVLRHPFAQRVAPVAVIATGKSSWK